MSQIEWKITNDYIYGKSKNFIFTNKLGMFDFDNTLATSKDSKRFPVDENDWKWRFQNTKDKLIDLIDNKYCIIIISNQGGINSGKTTSDIWIKKINNIYNDMNKYCYKLNKKFELLIFASIGQNIYRKPLPTFMYEFIPKNILSNIDQSSFYCGDAAGRPTDFKDSSGKPRDTDYKFALNCMIHFHTPERFFLDTKEILPKINYPVISEIIQSLKNKPNQLIVGKSKEMIVMIGFPGSGKSTLASSIASDNHNYETINQDKLKNLNMCKSHAEFSMINGKSLIIDATNSSRDTRKIWINLAKQYGYHCRAIKMNTSYELSKHNNYYRFFKSNGKFVPEIAYNIYKKKFQEPSIDEGFNEIIYIHPEIPDNMFYIYYLY